MPRARDRSRPRGGAQGIWRHLAALHNYGKPLAFLTQLARQHDGCIPIQLQSQRVFLLTAAEHFKQVLATNSQNYGKYIEGMRPIFGNAMITMDGALWQKMRALQQPAFHPDAISDYVPYFLDAINARIRRWTAIGAAETVDVSEESWALAADMTCKALFDRETPFNPHLVFNAVKAFTDVTNHDAIRLRCVDGKLVGAGDDEIAQATETWAALPKAILAADPLQGRERSLLKLIQTAAQDPAVPEFDQQHVLDEIKQYIWAGTETTALVLAWALYLTAVNRDVADRIRHEAEAVYGDRAPGFADYLKLSYTRNVIQETMRMYPPIWSLARRAEADDVISGHQIKAGDTMVMCSYAAHHDPLYWDNPDRFDPDRFTPERARGRVPYSYLPFGGGKRACVGSAMSQVETVLALSLFLRHFDLDYAGEGPAAINLTVTLSPKNGLPLRIRPRAGNPPARTQPPVVAASSIASPTISPATARTGCPFEGVRI